MAQVKLELTRRTDEELVALADTHVTMMTGNANFPTPAPTVAEFAAALNGFKAALLAANEAEMAARTAVQLKDDARGLFSMEFSLRGNYVQEASRGSEAEILSSGLGVRDVPSPIGPLPAPEDFMPTMGDMAGEVDLTWSAVRGARTYIVEFREQGVAGGWSSRLVTKSKCAVQGLTSGKIYIFHVAAVGAAGQGPWSLEAARMAP